MAARNREIESKWWVASSMDAVRSALESALAGKRDDVIAAQGVDTYWALTDTKFIRVRERGDGCQITVKDKDRSSNHNRVEIDVDCVSDTKQAMKLLTAVHGESTGSLDKSYWVYWLKGKDEHTNISLYTVKGHPGTFIEFEAPTQAMLMEIEAKYLKGLGELKREPKSLYELFILPRRERFVL